MILKNKYNVTKLSKHELISTSGGGIFKRFGSLIGGLWKDYTCSCGGEMYIPDYSDLAGSKL